MDINQISQLIQPKVSQTKSVTDNSSSNNSFELMLQEMLQNTASQDTSNALGLDSTSSANATNLLNELNGLNGTNLTNSVNATSQTGVQNKAVNGLDSLSLNPQKLAQMQEIMQMSSANSVMANFGSDDGSDSDSDSSSDDLAGMGSTNSPSASDQMTQLLQTVLQNQETGSSDTKNSANLSAQLQQIVAGMKL